MESFEFQYHLEKYHGMTSRHECPNCHDKHSFTYYVDVDGNPLDALCGKCNHENSCGYHLAPKQFFEANHMEYKKPDVTPSSKEIRPINYIPMEYVLRSRSDRNNLIDFIKSILDNEHMKIAPEIFDMYRIGSTKDGRIIYWQIDRNGLVRTGKVIKYDKTTGHRVKGQSDCVNWIHSMLKAKGVLNDDYNLGQCLFGEHLLTVFPDKQVFVVEAEKTAILCAICMPDFVWLATGGLSQMSQEKMTALKDREVILIPDTDVDGVAFNKWMEFSRRLDFCKSVQVCDYLERYSTPKQKEYGCDIADMLVDAFRIRKRTEQLNPNKNEPFKPKTKAERNMQAMTIKNPLLLSLVDKLSLQLINS